MTMTPNLITISHPVYGATPAATYSFFTSEYKPPAQARSLEMDIVHNQNGKFKYIYDNGPGFRSWAPFTVRCEESFSKHLNATAGKQYERITEMWNYPGVLGLKTPDGVYSVHWAANTIEQAFRAFPVQVGDKLEWEVVVQFEEAT